MIYGLLTGLVAGTSLKVGDVAPDFTVADTEWKEHTLSKMVEAGPVVLAFFPKAFTPG